MPYQFFSADNVPATNSAWISDCWAAVRSLKESRGWESVILVIDEIQKIANWSEVVKKEWDDDTFHDRDIKVLILGSSRVLLEKGLSESLAGRFEEIRMSGNEGVFRLFTRPIYVLWRLSRCGNFDWR